MKKTWLITAVILGGVVYLLIDLWLHDPFSSKAKVPMRVDALEFLDVTNGSEKVTIGLGDDLVLRQELKQLESSFKAAIKDSRSMQALDVSEQELTHSTVTDSPLISPWTIVDKTMLTEDVRLREGVELLQIVQIAPSALKSMNEGDQFNFPAINDKQYTVTVSKTKTLWNGDISIQGTLQSDDGNTFPVIISSGKNTTFASFSTSEGSFEVEVFGGVGGLYSVNEMDKQAFYPKTDELLN